MKVEFCPKHGSIFMDFNEDGEPYRRPICLDCRWESKLGRLIPKIVKASKLMKRKFFFMLHYGPDTAYIRRHLTNRLNRVVKGHFTTLEDVAYAIAGPKQDFTRVSRAEATTDQTDLVMARLRKFEEKHGSVRTKQTPEDKRTQVKINNAAQHRVDLDRMASLDAHTNERYFADNPSVRAADWAHYHELGGAKKRTTSEREY